MKFNLYEINIVVLALASVAVAVAVGAHVRKHVIVYKALLVTLTLSPLLFCYAVAFAFKMLWSSVTWTFNEYRLKLYKLDEAKQLARRVNRAQQ